ncbi:hypothetical protein MUY27_02320 [Mucilaginibacter sp. RS28]|uniref:Uncharacterized protein n=1 Tax=Mucilaginibacter straminoryzae TaxID=2932774 RepID=A0A9X1WZJ6_9SPHI|nr:hypothetical protein [Mucilaginibacter straminoryzae]MCJ8208527.1 hypothetical protein [Mucilaginibacter straminoryzae]
MRKICIYLMMIGIVLIIAGSFFYTAKPNTAANSSVALIKNNNPTAFRWPVHTGLILFFMGGTFTLASRRKNYTSDMYY